MFEYFSQKTEKRNITMRFSILAIFISFFLTTMLILITVTYVRFRSEMEGVAIQLMKKTSQLVFNGVTEELHDVSLESQFAAKLFEHHVVNPKDPNNIIEYVYHFLQIETETLPSVQSIYWGDVNGNFILASITPEKNINIRFIDRSNALTVGSFVTKDQQEKIISSGKIHSVEYDPRTRPWYLETKTKGSITRTEVYKSTYWGSNKLGITVASPVYKENRELLGIFALNIRLDNLRHFIENITTSKNGVVFIVDTNGKLIAYPKLHQVDNPALTDIHSISNLPAIDSFDLYSKKQKEEFLFNSNGEKYIATYQVIPDFGSNHWLIAVVVPQRDFTSAMQRHNLILLGISLLILMVGIFSVSKLVTLVVRPLKRLAKQTEKIKRFELDKVKRIPSRISEVIALSNAIYSMQRGLRSFQRYVPASLVRQLIEAGEDARVGGTKKKIAILFTDIKDFTSISETEEPNTLMLHICEYLEELSNIIISTSGTIDKYIGDSIMAFWGAPLAVENPSHQAAFAALSCLRRLKVVNLKWESQGIPMFYTRFGIHIGEAIVGNLGSSERLNYTAIGDAANTASRLEGVNKIYETQIIVSDAVYHDIKDDFSLRMLDYIIVKGKAEAHYIYELLAENKSELSFDLDAYRLAFSSGFSCYQAKSWDEAIKYFEKCLLIYLEDTVATIFIKRCVDFKLTPPPVDWNGVWVISEK